MKSSVPYESILKYIYVPYFQRSHVFKWDGQSRSKWTKLDEVKIELPMETIVQAEVVQELRGEVSFLSDCKRSVLRGGN